MLWSSSKDTVLHAANQVLHFTGPRFRPGVLQGLLTMERFLGSGQPMNRRFCITLEQFNRFLEDVGDSQQPFGFPGRKSPGRSTAGKSPIRYPNKSGECNDIDAAVRFERL
jgi:hypothetical protein